MSNWELSELDQSSGLQLFYIDTNGHVRIITNPAGEDMVWTYHDTGYPTDLELLSPDWTGITYQLGILDCVITPETNVLLCGTLSQFSADTFALCDELVQFGPASEIEIANCTVLEFVAVPEAVYPPVSRDQFSMSSFTSMEPSTSTEEPTSTEEYTATEASTTTEESTSTETSTSTDRSSSLEASTSTEESTTTESSTSTEASTSVESSTSTEVSTSTESSTITEASTTTETSTSTESYTSGPTTDSSTSSAASEPSTEVSSELSTMTTTTSAAPTSTAVLEDAFYLQVLSGNQDVAGKYLNVLWKTVVGGSNDYTYMPMNTTDITEATLVSIDADGLLRTVEPHVGELYYWGYYPRVDSVNILYGLTRGNVTLQGKTPLDCVITPGGSNVVSCGAELGGTANTFYACGYGEPHMYFGPPAVASCTPAVLVAVPTGI
ncbi:hypothetical protein GE09DRAFT_148993 [Coniochaeta sp. 2T2.1]|nr:hypothetical protein GE09DRAFT_148993 [Coniochaeta sp. 2T2.1]